MKTKTLKAIGKSKLSIPARTAAHMHCSSARNPEKDVRPTNRVRPAGHSPWCAETSRSVDQLILYPSTFPLPRFRTAENWFWHADAVAIFRPSFIVLYEIQGEISPLGRKNSCWENPVGDLVPEFIWERITLIRLFLFGFPQIEAFALKSFRRGVPRHSPLLVFPLAMTRASFMELFRHLVARPVQLDIESASGFWRKTNSNPTNHRWLKSPLWTSVRSPVSSADSTFKLNSRPSIWTRICSSWH